MGAFIVCAAVIAAILVGVAPRADAASKMLVATGTWTYAVDTQTLMRTAGSDHYYEEVASNAYGGGLSGIATDHDTFVMHKDGTEYSHDGSELCASCTLGGRTGAFTAVFGYTVSGLAGTTPTCVGTLHFTRGLGGLVGLHGGGTFACTVLLGNVFVGTYSYTYGFAK